MCTADSSGVLITRAGGGDAEAIDSLLERHLPPLRAYVRLRMGPRIRRWETESDVIQSVCLEIFRDLDGFDYRGEAAFRQWLFTAARHKLVARNRYYRAEKRDVGRVETRPSPPSDADDRLLRAAYGRVGSPSEHAVARETLEGIETALDGLPKPAREVILLSRLAGLTNEEIARSTGKTESAVTTLLCRSLAELARKLAY